MDERKTAPPSIASRTAVKAAVAVLIVIAIAGIVLATLRGRTGAPEVAGTASTQPGGSAPTAAAATAGSDDGAPNEVVFGPTSDQLSPAALAKLALLADTAKKEKHTVSVAAKIEASGDRDGQRELAKKRAYNIRGVLEQRGVPLGTMRIEVTEFPAGLAPPAARQRVEIVLH
jgi:outer membrane protein OmpA-like peptidoglycan-associated protein